MLLVLSGLKCLCVIPKIHDLAEEGTHVNTNSIPINSFMLLVLSEVDLLGTEQMYRNVNLFLVSGTYSFGFTRKSGKTWHSSLDHAFQTDTFT